MAALVVGARGHWPVTIEPHFLPSPPPPRVEGRDGAAPSMAAAPVGAAPGQMPPARTARG